MRNNSIYDFYDRLTTDRAFAGELEQFFQTKTISSPDDEVIALAEFAANHGYDITMESITDFAEKQCQALTPEELDSINAAGAGGLCIVIGVGWGCAKGAESGPTTHCYVAGIGVGVTWKEAPDNSRCTALWRNGSVVNVAKEYINGESQKGS